MYRSTLPRTILTKILYLFTEPLVIVDNSARSLDGIGELVNVLPVRIA